MRAERSSFEAISQHMGFSVWGPCPLEMVTPPRRTYLWTRAAEPLYWDRDRRALLGLTVHLVKYSWGSG
jgi:hypothetical protein